MGMPVHRDPSPGKKLRRAVAAQQRVAAGNKRPYWAPIPQTDFSDEEVRNFIPDNVDKMIVLAMLDFRQDARDILFFIMHKLAKRRRNLTESGINQRLVDPLRRTWYAWKVNAMLPTMVPFIHLTLAKKALGGSFMPAKFFLERWDKEYRPVTRTEHVHVHTHAEGLPETDLDPILVRKIREVVGVDSSQRRREKDAPKPPAGASGGVQPQGEETALRDPSEGGVAPLPVPYRGLRPVS